MLKDAQYKLVAHDFWIHPRPVYTSAAQRQRCLK
ncbi:hypothetical protein ACP_1545 [Acidobacterium capsulatum ATCC 51196]|uniref:Uncharacterized protein n=1 Tax=Acidobacterium capsulatum (strain ATCC 51196 / DSM 11244 / BCRC 80197 / JCM 7670 / NBRC 15755 / NCIMB 13165 / 161) TaxID=240015 RepID=C1F6N8_ACIC5|nr:hypothetical protein ACP_1545 [Acidobacterium capsulatum ATCC 51196]